MHRALALAETVRGRTSPNPAVGAVILDADRAAGRRGRDRAGRRGRTPRSPPCSTPGPAARGGTAVVTLEPCAHTGRTGPCADALDRGRGGARRLRRRRPEPGGGRRRPGAARCRRRGADAGVEAHAAASGALRPWLHAVRTGRPYVTWKFAATLDGRVAAADRTSRWISSAASRADAHRLRGVVDAILVGSGTVLTDDPHLTARDGDALAERQPLRVVLDRRHRRPGRRPGARRRRRDRGPRHSRAPVRPESAATTAACGTSCWRAGLRWRGRSSRPGASTRWSPTSRRCCSGAGPAALGDAGIGTTRRRRDVGGRVGVPARRRPESGRPAALGEHGTEE